MEPRTVKYSRLSFTTDSLKRRSTIICLLPAKKLLVVTFYGYQNKSYLAEIAWKIDPKNSGYVVEPGAQQCYMFRIICHTLLCLLYFLCAQHISNINSHGQCHWVVEDKLPSTGEIIVLYLY